KLIAAGLECSIEAGAGAEAGFRDEAYREVGVEPTADKGALLSGADVVFKVQPPTVSEVGLLKKGALLISFLQPSTQGPVLQALATARRLGAVVESYDVRPAVKEEVQSLGARFLELELEAQEGEGGYARAQSDEFLQKQRELLTDRVSASDVVVTTAAIPG